MTKQKHGRHSTLSFFSQYEILGVDKPPISTYNRVIQLNKGVNKMTTYKVKELWTGDTFIWTEDQLLYEVNRDRSTEWQDYTIEDLQRIPKEVIEWLDGNYEIEILL